MGVNASTLGLTHYEDLPVEILQLVVAEMRKPVDDGSSWPVLSKVCKGWRRAAGCDQHEGGVSRQDFDELPGWRELRLQPDSYRKLLVKEDENMLFAKLAHLTRLEVRYPAPWAARYLRGRDALSFSCLTQLKELSIEGPPATVFLHLAGISTLTRLECGQWEDEINTLSQLRSLEMTNCQEVAFEGIAVSNLSKLVSLHLGLRGVHEDVDSRMDFSKLQKLPALTELHLTYAEMYLWNRTVEHSEFWISYRHCTSATHSGAG
ncbi:hypothetical protein WJX77_008855 [Trebouxia sp. C0004]